MLLFRFFSSFVRCQHRNSQLTIFFCILNTNEDIFVIHQSIFDSICSHSIHCIRHCSMNNYYFRVNRKTCSGCNVNIDMRFVCVSNAVNLHINTGWMVRSFHTQKKQTKTPQNQWITLYSQTHADAHSRRIESSFSTQIYYYAIDFV